jgi:hypothetical protein
MHGCRPWLLALATACLLGSLVPAQQPSTPPPSAAGTSSSDSTDDEYSTRDTTVGYIDSALPADLFRFRFDAAYDSNRPNRAEFFYAQTAPRGPGLPRPERRIDYQELSVYGERKILPSLSLFGEVPVRFLNPEVNKDSWGLSDVDGGAKYAFVNTEDFVASFQLRVYAPTGAASRGLGNRHTTLEPALLVWWRPAERWGVEGELRYWAPVGGTDFAGDIARYGVGVHYDLTCSPTFRVSPVVELIGWTVLSGKEPMPVPGDGVLAKSAAGDTIVNVKLGVRVGLGERSDLYAGYGRALTGDHWYTDTLRVEWRWMY